MAGQRATIEIRLDGAAVSFTWRFDPASDLRTKLIQRITLKGEKAAGYVPQIEAGFKSAPEGMKRLAEAMARAAPNSISAG
jgi:hypothetical protein